MGGGVTPRPEFKGFTSDGRMKQEMDVWFGVASVGMKDHCDDERVERVQGEALDLPLRLHSNPYARS